MAKKQSIKSLGYGIGCMTCMLACGPVPVDGVPVDGEGYGYATTDDGGVTTTGIMTDDGGEPDGTGAAGGGPSENCQNMAPPLTYVCAGDAQESEVAGAAALQLITRPAAYSCQEDPYYYYYYGGSGGYGSGGGGYASGGATYASGGAAYYAGDGDGDTTGDTGVYYGGDGDGDDYYGGDGDGDDYYGGDGDGYYGYGGAYGYGGSYGAGGGLPTGGFGNGGGSSGDLLSDWCSDLDANDQVAGASFAVGTCQLTDLALPIKITEPSYGRYEVFVYGGSSACERGSLLAKTAGIGTGLTINIPVDTSGVAFVSVEMVSDNYWENLELRLVDRPAVGDSGQ